jgi:transcriptional regulator with XRE-family HTH domain
MDAEFGRRIRRLRKARGLTLKEVATEIGCSESYAWQLERHPGRRPAAPRMMALARVLGTTIQELLGEPPPISGSMSAIEGGDGSGGADGAFYRAYLVARPEEKRILQDLLQSLIRNRSDIDL